MPSLASQTAVEMRQLWRREVDDCVVAAAWSPSGLLLAAATADGAVEVYDRDGEGCRRLSSHRFGALATAWSPSGKRLASAGQDGLVRLWDCELDRELAPINAGGEEWVEHLAWCPRAELLASAAGQVVRLWDMDGQLLHEYPALSHTVAGLAWRPASRRLTAAAYGGLTMWDGETLKPSRTFKWLGSMLTIAWSPDGRYLATGDQDLTAHLWTFRTGRVVEMAGYDRKVRDLAWDASSRFLATGGGNDVTIWDCAGAGPEATRPIVLRGHEAAISGLVFQHGGPLLASADEVGRVALWRPGRSRRLLAEVSVPSGVTQLSWSPDDRLLLAGTENGELTMLGVA